MHLAIPKKISRLFVQQARAVACNTIAEKPSQCWRVRLLLLSACCPRLPQQAPRRRPRNPTFPTLASIAGASVPNDRPIDGVDQSNFFQGKSEKSAREGILIWCADRLQAAKWHHFKIHFYKLETMVSPPIKLGLPLIFNLYENPREDEEKVFAQTWVVGPILKLVAEFEESVKKHPLIAMGTPDPYAPP
jgi:arylsulfatase